MTVGSKTVAFHFHPIAMVLPSITAIYKGFKIIVPKLPEEAPHIPNQPNANN